MKPHLQVLETLATTQIPAKKVWQTPFNSKAPIEAVVSSRRCFSCRRRAVACNEALPSCSSCARREDRCLYTIQVTASAFCVQLESRVALIIVGRGVAQRHGLAKNVSREMSNVTLAHSGVIQLARWTTLTITRTRAQRVERSHTRKMH